MKCWGRTLDGGAGGEIISGSQGVPTDVPGLATGVVQISAGISHTCAVTTEARAKCWGVNIYGTLGDGTERTSAMPVDVAGLTEVAAISPGGAHTCALTVSGAVKCWGLNDESQLGSGVVGHERTTPVDVAGLESGVIAIAAGGAHTCALMSAGTVKCWGGNNDGQMGNGATSLMGQATPLEVPGVVGAVAISAGYQYSCALLSDATAQCWGGNNFGQLGNGHYSQAQPFATPVGTFALQTITFDGPGSRDINASPFQPAATASSGLPVTYVSRSTQVCTANGSTVTLLSIGICELAAQQTGNEDYVRASDVVRWLLVTGTASGAPPRMRSISTRARALSGDDVVIAGFVIHGSASQQKRVLIRARGPSLMSSGVADPLANPVLRLFSGPNVIATSDDWRTGASVAILESIGYAPSNNLESAILTTLNSGSYTAVATGANNGTGVTIIEVVEIDRADVPFSGISTRALVLSGDDVLIGGFVVEGSSDQAIVVRARGPSLAAAGIANPLANPVLQLVRSSDQAVIAVNDDWGTAANAGELSASGFAPTDPLESAILVTLQPGAYTAIVRGTGNGTGIGIVEVFAP